ncbi:MAG: sulfatase-like hydrolase/transferase [Bacteroidetes bacterium]|nr:sulfatase-like hydrolase/transferase [Bacteroidota bacterium]
MKKIYLLQTLLFCIIYCFAQQGNNNKTQNILLILSDDQNYNTLSVLGNNEIHTPNLDRLAKEGMLFSQTHVMGGHQGAICMPSRAMLLTGRYLNRLPGDGMVIPDSLASLPEVLRSKGYTTYHTGKWHSDKASYHRFFSDGGDIFFGGMHTDGGYEHPTVYKFDSSGLYPVSLKRVSDTFSTQLFADNAIRFLNSSKAKQQPFFCYIAFTSPHDPRTPSVVYRNMYKPESISIPPNFMPEHPFDNGDLNIRDEKLLPKPLSKMKLQNEIALYYGMISEMDYQIGRILDVLKQNNLTENTLIIFASDNGLALGQHGLLGKQNLYEHSIRVPMIISGKSVPKGTIYNGFNYLSDITPTVLNYLNIPNPKSVEAKSLFPVFKSPNLIIRKSIYNIYGNWLRSVKTLDGYKLIVYDVNGIKHTQLFDLNTDKWEQFNLADDPNYSKKIEFMKMDLINNMKETHDDLDITKSNWGRKIGMKASGNNTTK